MTSADAAQALGIADRVTVADFPTIGAEYWAVLDVYCQPAIEANAGVTLLQAMAHAVPCLTTSTAGLRGLVQPGTSGLIVPPGDPHALGDAIAELLDRPDEARRMGQAARRRVGEHFDPEAEADRLVRLYLDIIGASGEPEPLAS